MSHAIELFWDQEARVWVAISKDVPGLVLESESLDTLLERARLAAPELLELNGQRTSQNLGSLQTQS